MFQFVFMVIAADPVRFRPMMIVAVLEKLMYSSSLVVLYLQHRMHASDLVLVATDLLLGLLFVAAYFKTPSQASIR